MAPPPWEVQYIDPAIVGGGADRWFVMSDPHHVNVGPLSDHEWEPTAHYMASWHPAVALAVADVLDLAAQWAEDHPGSWPPANKAALVVANAYLGTP